MVESIRLEVVQENPMRRANAIAERCGLERMVESRRVSAGAANSVERVRVKRVGSENTTLAQVAARKVREVDQQREQLG